MAKNPRIRKIFFFLCKNLSPWGIHLPQLRNGLVLGTVSPLGDKLFKRKNSNSYNLEMIK